ncbi:MAG: hypothetical protein AB1705_03735 [Verrucomicrobiota bacterium]
MLWVGLVLLVAVFAEAAPAPGTSGDVIQLFDGSRLHGQLNGVNAQGGVLWRHPEAKKDIEFGPTNLYLIQFQRAQTPLVAKTPGCRFRFANNDEVWGDLISLDEKQVVLETWFAGRLTAPREAIRSLTFLNQGLATLYEGPTSMEGWLLGQGTGAWSYRDGMFVSTGVGSLGRAANLPSMSQVEFDLHWTGHVSLILSLYTEAIDRFDFGASSYQFYAGAGAVNLQRVQGRVGMTHLGQAVVPALVTENKVHLDFRVNREKATFALLVNGVLTQEWQDQGGFSANGTGLAFYSQRTGSDVRLSNLRIGQWDGRMDVIRPARTNVVSETVLTLVNEDQAKGNVTAIQNGKVTLVTPKATLPIPLERVTEILMATTKETATGVPTSAVQAQFAGGGKVTLQVARWDAQAIEGNSPLFGRITLKPEWIRQLQFNLGRGKNDADDLEFFSRGISFDREANE